MRFRTILLATCLTLSATAAHAQAEHVDGDNEPPNQFNGMHTCTGTYAMAGVHVDNNDLLCTGSFQFVVGSIFMDLGSQFLMPDGRSAHWCGRNAMMAGVHVDNNVFNCLPFTASFLYSKPNPLGPPVVDRSTVRFGMHACPRGSVMVGAYFADNILLCSKLNFCMVASGNTHCPEGKACYADTPSSLTGTCW